MNTSNKLRSFPKTLTAPLTQDPLLMQKVGKQTVQVEAFPTQQLAGPVTQVSGEAGVGVDKVDLTRVYPELHW